MVFPTFKGFSITLACDISLPKRMGHLHIHSTKSIFIAGYCVPKFKQVIDVTDPKSGKDCFAQELESIELFSVSKRMFNVTTSP